MKVWITKYATTKGIIEADDAESCEKTSTQMILVKSIGQLAYFHGEGKEWHRTQESAIARAQQMREKAIAIHQKAIEKLQKMRFS